MNKRKLAAPLPTPVSSTGTARRRVTRLLGVAAAIAILVFAGSRLRSPFLWLADRALYRGSVCDAQWWLEQCPWLGSRGGRAELLRAACHRQLQEPDLWNQAIESARRAGAAEPELQREIRLADVRSGRVDDGGPNPLGGLIEAGAPLYEVATTFVHGYLTREEPDRARAVLEGWRQDTPHDVNLPYVEGVLLDWSSRRAEAEQSFRAALAQEPRHDLARIALQELLEEQNRLQEALAHAEELAKRSPRPDTRELDLARLLRKQGLQREARERLKILLAQPIPVPGAALELGQLELEAGNYREAEDWLSRGRGAPHDEQRQMALAVLHSLTGRAGRNGELLTQIDANKNRSVRSYDEQIRLLLDSRDPSAANALPPGPSSASSIGSASAVPPVPVSQLFLERCAACHGQHGDGWGRAARLCYPRPRNLRADRLRLVSAANAQPTLDDILRVIRQGMPGTAMPAHRDLTDKQVSQLATEVQRMQVEGARERWVAELVRMGEEVPAATETGTETPAELREALAPGETAPLPDFPDHDKAGSLARGQQLYLESGCQGCHGEDGTGSSDGILFDDRGQAARARDLVWEPFKGGNEPASLYRRIRLGMPGTPHPASSTLSAQQLVDLVVFCQSLSRTPKRRLTNHERERLATPTAYAAAFTDPPGGSAGRSRSPAIAGSARRLPSLHGR